VLDRTRHRAHGRVEIRTLKAVTVRGLGFPHASQVLQVTRKTRDLRNLAIGVLCRAGPVNLAAALRFHSRDPHRPLATLGIRLGWASLHSFPATMLELRLTQRPASRHRWLSAEPAGWSGPRRAERTPRRRCPVVPWLSSQAIFMDYCLEVRASGFTRMLAGR
jgi:hypothetical protein